MPNNLELWELVERTDPRAVKKITGKSYGGDSPSPHWLIRRATETFGPCGVGWGFAVIDERIEVGSEPSDRVSIARVRVWYKWKGERGEVEHVGGTVFSGKRKSGQLFSDEDAPKKSVTDALVKALSMIGFAGDIFGGRWDDSKYQAELREEFSPTARKPDDIGRDMNGQPPHAASAISAGEAKEFRELLKSAGRTEEAFLTWAGLRTIEDMTRGQLAEAQGIISDAKKKRSVAPAGRITLAAE